MGGAPPYRSFQKVLGTGVKDKVYSVEVKNKKEVGVEENQVPRLPLRWE